MKQLLPRLVLGLALILMTSTARPLMAAGQTQNSAQAPVEKFVKARKKVQDQYIVVFNKEIASEEVLSLVHELSSRVGAMVLDVYEYAPKGFSARMTEKDAKKLSKDARVAYVEEGDQSEVSGVQTNPPNWGLDRIDQRLMPLNYTYSYSSTGAGVTAYIIDTGLNIAHMEFRGRVVGEKDFVYESGFYPSPGNYGEDCDGHGTHVAGILGGNTYGVAKEVGLYPVRVGALVRCSDHSQIAPGIYNSIVIKALNWIVANRRGPSVVNMSIYDYDGDPAVDEAVRGLIEVGVPVVAGVGDLAGDVGGSPAHLFECISVGATDSFDRKIPWTEMGPALDVFAPGYAIRSAWIDSPTSSEYLSGTSMATPHVAGAVALYLQRNPMATPAQVQQFIVASSTKDVVKGVGYSAPNRLLYIQP